MKKFLLVAWAVTVSVFANAATLQTVEIPISIPIVDAVQHQQDLYFASHSGLLKLSQGNLFKLKDSGIDLGRLRQVEISADQNQLYAGGFGLWQLDLPDYALNKIYPGWVSRFAVSDKYFYVDTGSELLALPKDKSQTKTKIFGSPITAITQVENEVYALTRDGLYALMNTVSRLVKQGQFKTLLSNPLYMVMSDTESVHIFSRTTNQWYQFPLPVNVSRIEMSAQEDAVWLRTDSIWKKYSLVNFKQLDQIDKYAAFFYDSQLGPVMFDGSSLNLNKKVPIFDIQSKSLVASATIEPFLFHGQSDTYASGVGGIYSVTTGELVFKTDAHITAFDTRDGKSFTIGTSKGVILPDGQLINNGYVYDIDRHNDETYIAFEQRIYKQQDGFVKELLIGELKGQEILNLKSEDGKLYVLTSSNIYTLGSTLEKVASLSHAVWEDVIQIDEKLYALSYNHGIFEVQIDGKLDKLEALQSLPNRFFIRNNTAYVIGREGICRIDTKKGSCTQISASVTGRSTSVTENGIYYSNPHGVWLLDERAMMANPNLQFVLLNQRPVLDKNITIEAGEAIALHFDLKDGTVLIDGEEHSIYNHQVIYTPDKSININGWSIQVDKGIYLMWLLYLPFSIAIGWSVWSLVKAKSIANAEFVRLSRFQLHADQIRKSCDLSVEISAKLNQNNDLALADAIYLSHEMQEILSPIAMNARLRDSDNLSFALKSHVASIFCIHPDLDVSIGQFEKINGKLNADAYHLLIHMLRYSIDRLGAKKVTIHVLSETEQSCLLCAEHDGKSENMLQRFISRSTDYMIMRAIAMEYGQTMKFYPGEINVLLCYSPKTQTTPQQAYFTASASKFGS